jgi:hypothetical protein
VEPRFGDLVRIVSTPETERAGLAGLVGRVRSETQPSVSGVEVIGAVADDFALQVDFDDPKGSRWLTLELVEFVDPKQKQSQRSGSTTPPQERVRPKTEEWQEKDLPSSRWQRFVARLRGRA